MTFLTKVIDFPFSNEPKQKTMAIFLKLRKNQMPTSKNFGKWLALPQSQGEVTTADLARRINANSTFRESEVKGIIKELVQEMKLALQDGQTVVLDDFGRFHLSVEADAVDDPEEFSVQKHVHRIKCKFVEAGRRRTDNTLERPLSTGAKLELQPYYEKDE